MKKQFIAAGVAATIGVAGLGAGVVSAATDSTSSTSHMSGLVDKISEKFNLNKTEVQSVFNEQRATMEAERETEAKNATSKLVTDGKITQSQADAINAKRAELQKEREANRASGTEKTAEERKVERDTKRTELETWAKEQGIDTQYLRYVMGHGGKGGHGGMGGPRGEKAADTSTTTTE